MNNTATLYVVATPIGNLADMSERALSILKSVDLIAAEDTRHSQHLLAYYGIKTPMISLHDHNEGERTEQLANKLQQNKEIALICDAGTPLISDPGYRFVRHIAEAGFTVVPIPGPCALISALSAAGLPTDRFIFEGFLPHKSQARQQRLMEVKNETRTLVYYEAKHRIKACLQDMIACFGEDREVVLAKELTKMHETFVRDDLHAVLAWLEADPKRENGEFVMMVRGAKQIESEISDESARIFKLLREELPLKQAAKLGAKITGVKKNALYEFGLKADPQ